MMESTSHKRGRLKVYLGFAAGVGKTYQMLEDAHELVRRGVDVGIGYLEPHGRKATIAQALGLELIPRCKMQYRGAVFEEMNMQAILERHPEVCVVDELPHTNVPGCSHLKRWECVLELLDAGIDVMTTMNIQHLESLNDQVRDMTGVRVRETIPDWVMKQADEVVMVDLTPRALLNRLERGVVYPPEKAQRALQNFFKESTLVALREIALRQTAHEVEIRQVTLPESTTEVTATVAEESSTGGSDFGGLTDRILVYITEHPSTAMLIRRGRRVADYVQADCFAIFVHAELDFNALPTAKREAVERHLNFARNLHIETRVLQGQDIAITLLEFARLHNITQLFMVRPQYSPWEGFIGRNLIHRIVRDAHDMQVTIVAERQPVRRE
ncbi:MAG: histidine kinase [Terriglobia bacterium]|jgi:two-component system sensor histidine kinase KdpD